MHIHQVNRYTKLLRESYRDSGTVKKFTIANVTDWDEAELSRLFKLIDLQRQARGTPRESQANFQLSQLLVAHTVDFWRLSWMLSTEEKRLRARNLQKRRYHQTK